MNFLSIVSTAGSSSSNLAWTLTDAFGNQALWIVVFGGFIGGLLQPVVSRLNPRTPAPETSHYLLGPLLGIAAAGISVFVLANSKTDDALRLLFFALLCGLAFPAILTSAVDNVSKRTDEVRKEVAEIADKARSNDPTQLADAVNQLRSTLVQNPANAITAEGQASVEKSAEQAVRNIAQTVEADAAQARVVVEQLRDVATVAQSAGYGDLAQKTTETLEKLSQTDSIKDKDAKKAAEDAVTHLQG
jgi:hypothetical protein